MLERLKKLLSGLGHVGASKTSKLSIAISPQNDVPLPSSLTTPKIVN